MSFAAEKSAEKSAEAEIQAGTNQADFPTDLEKSSSHSNDVHSASSEEDFGLPKSRGVSRIEAVHDYMSSGFTLKYIFFASIFITATVKALESSTVTNYTQFATSSFGHHSMLSTLQIATSIISAICKPFLAKFSDLTSRPTTYVVVLTIYVIGYIIIACSPTITAYVIGSAFVSVGDSGLELLNSIIIADLTPLQYRGVVSGILASPYLVTTWISGYIVQHFVAVNWRWGYGMFCILIPACLLPAIVIMFVLDHKAEKQGLKKLSANPLVEHKDKFFSLTTIKTALIEIDAFGLIILGFAFSLLLLPFSLYPTAENGWKNPSMIAMIIVGGILFIAYCLYESLWAPFPSMPRRVLINKTFICCVIIDFVYMLAGYIRLLYFSSYTYVITNWSVKNWTYFSNTLTMGLCFFGVVAGIIHRLTHRYKLFQVFGLSVKIIGMGLFVMLTTQGINNGVLISSTILDSIGSAFSVIATQVAAQAAVPHQDLATTISLLSLYSSIGAAIGSAIAAPIWSSKLPKYLGEYTNLNSTEISEYLGSTEYARSLPWGSQERNDALRAYNKTCYYLFVPALALTFISLIAACFQTDFYLGKQLNCVEGEQPTEKEQIKFNDDGAPLKWYQKVANFFNRPLY